MPTETRPKRSPLSRETWVEAALEALASGGPEAVAVQPLAARLGATKGSFYWHFDTRDELLQGALDRWRHGTLGIIEEIDRTASDGPPEVRAAVRLRALLDLVARAVAEPPGEQRILSGIHDPLVRAVVADVTARRIAYVARLLAESGLGAEDAQRRAFHAYAWFLGYAQLAATQPQAVPAGLDALLDEVTALLLDVPETAPS